MKRWIKNGIGILIFLFMLTGIFAALQPLYRYINASMKDFEQKALALLEEKTGLGLSYKSFSPSLLTGLHIKGIEIYDKESGERILTIRNAHAGYRLREIVRANWSAVFTRLTINDITFDFDKEKYAHILEKLLALVPESDKKEEVAQKTSLVSQELLSTINTVLFTLPFDVRLNNVGVRYKDKNDEIIARVKSVDLKKQSDTSAMAVNLSGSVLAKLDVLKGKTAGVTFKTSGKFLQDISGSSAIISIDRMPRADYSLNNTEFLVRYSQQELVLRTTKENLPYSIFAQVGLDSGDIAAQVNTTALDPFSLVRMPPLTGGAAMVVGTRITTSAEAQFNVFSKKYSWSANGGAALSKAISKNPESLEFTLSGNNTDIFISSLKAHGLLLEAELNGRFYIPSLQPNGVLYVDHYTLPNGSQVSGDVYIEPQGTGVLAFVPQLFLGEQTLTALQVEVQPGASKSIDFSLSVNDYSHIEYENAGELVVTGNVAFEGGTDVQAQVSLSNFFIDSIAGAAAFALDTKTQDTIRGFLPRIQPFISSGEFYVSTNLQSVTFNAPYFILANTEESRQALFLSFDGTERAVQVSLLDLMYNNQSVRASIDADISLPDKQVLFSSDINVNNIPYQIAGIYSLGEWLNITGDYGLDVLVNFSNPLTGHLTFANFPIAISDYILSLSTDASFLYSPLEGPEVTIENFMLEEVSGTLRLMPRLALSGRMDSKGVVIEQLSYSDIGGDLDGNGYALWSLSEGIVDTLTFDVNLQSPFSKEKIDIEGSIINPLKRPLQADFIKSDYYFSAQAAISSLQLSRFLPDQGEENSLTGTLTASGTVEDPYLALNIDSFSAQLGGSPLLVNGNLAFVEGNVSIPNIDAVWNMVTVSGITGEFNAKDFAGSLSTRVRMNTGSLGLSAPLSFTVKKSAFDTSTSLIPDVFSVAIDSSGLTGSFIRSAIPLHFVVNRTPERISITSDEYFGFSGEFIPGTGEVSALIDRTKPIHFALDGFVKNNVLDMRVSDIFVNAAHFAYLFNSSSFSLYSGSLTGRVALTGLYSDPSFDGALHVQNVDFNLPDFVPDHLTTPDIMLTLNHDKIEVQETNFSIKDSILTLNAGVQLDRWGIDSAHASLLTRTVDMPVDAKVSFLRLKGRTGLNVRASYDKSTIDVSGSISLRDTEITVLESLSDLNFTSQKEVKVSSSSGAPLDVGLNVDLRLLFGQKVNIAINPILRGLVAPQTPIHFTLDSENELWSLDGDVALRGGEVFYLNRNFYLKEGRVSLNESQTRMDPLLTVRAEVREHDENGENVTISLSAMQQRLSQFNPTLSATPAKSESEIMALLGQVLRGDSSSWTDVISTVGDFATQSVLVRKLENSLRDLLNFDIFSVRTTLLQNAIRQGLSGNDTNNYSLGNYFDNSTVYIGKYFGSDIYADALMHWSYNDTMADADSVLGGLMFQPELGLEFSAPFANIRWQFAPNLGALQNSWVPATSITLSWSFTF